MLDELRLTRFRLEPVDFPFWAEASTRRRIGIFSPVGGADGGLALTDVRTRRTVATEKFSAVPADTAVDSVELADTGSDRHPHAGEGIFFRGAANRFYAVDKRSGRVLGAADG